MGFDMASRCECARDCRCDWINDVRNGSALQVPLREGPLCVAVHSNLQCDWIYGLVHLLHGVHAVQHSMGSPILHHHLPQSGCGFSCLHLRQRNSLSPSFLLVLSRPDEEDLPGLHLLSGVLPALLLSQRAFSPLPSL